MGENTSSTVIALRVPLDVAAALMRMAEMREISMNAMVGRMISKRVIEIRQEEGW